jgi:hypothetical protein
VDRDGASLGGLGGGRMDWLSSKCHQAVIPWSHRRATVTVSMLRVRLLVQRD